MRSQVGIMDRTTTSVIQLLDRKVDLWIELQWTHSEGRPPWSAELYVTGLILVSMRSILGADWQPKAMEMLSPWCPAYERTGLPDCPIQWNAPTISVAIDRQDMAVRLAGSAPCQGDKPIKSIPDLSEASPELVCETIFGLLRQEGRNMSDVANCFGLTKRSFHRRLDSHGLHFRQIVENFRIERAMNVLQLEDVSVTELSLELGYDHPQNFARAFRRLVGLSPRQYRSAFSKTADELVHSGNFR
jgi:AraC-like DNA-binding protein